MIITVSNL